MKKIALCLIVLLLALWGYNAVKAQSLAVHSIRYESGLLWATQREAISGTLVNLDSVSHSYRVQVFQGFTSVYDSGTASIASASAINGGYLIPSGVTDGFQVEITVDSEKIIPLVVIKGNSVPPRLTETGSQLMMFKDHSNQTDEESLDNHPSSLFQN